MMKVNSHEDPKIGIVLLNWNGADDTIACIASLKKVSYSNLFIIVIENASTDNSYQRLYDWLQSGDLSWSATQYHNAVSEEQPSAQPFPEKDILLIKSSENLGFCKGNNLGMKLAIQHGAEYIVVLNNDTEVAPDFLEPLVDVAENAKQAGLVGGIITYCDKPDTIWWAGGTFNRFLDNIRLLDRCPLSALTQTQPFETEWVSGCLMMIPAHVYNQLGGFEESYFIWSEEWEYSLRVAHAGYTLFVAPQSRICHKVGRSLGIMTPLNYYYGIRNGLLFKRKYFPGYLWYPYFLYYLLNRAIRYTQFFLQGRAELAYAGISAIWDYCLGRTGIWNAQRRSPHKKT